LWTSDYPETTEGMGDAGQCNGGLDQTDLADISGGKPYRASRRPNSAEHITAVP